MRNWSNAVENNKVANKIEYIERLQMVIHQLHGCDSEWRETVPVTEMFMGKVVWDGEVEVFDVKHKKAHRAYAWSDSDGNFTAVLGIPPVIGAKNAVRVSIVAAGKKGAK